MLATLLGIFASSGFGAILGLIGSFLTKTEERKQRQLELTNMLELAKVRKEEAKIESDHELAMADKQTQRAQLEGQIKTELGDIAAFQESLKSQSVSTGIKAIDAIRGIVRPLITVYLLILTSILTFQIWKLVGGLSSLETAVLTKLFIDSIDKIFFLTTTAVTWWFGSRNPASGAKK